MKYKHVAIQKENGTLVIYVPNEEISNWAKDCCTIYKDVEISIEKEGYLELRGTKIQFSNLSDNMYEMGDAMEFIQSDFDIIKCRSLRTLYFIKKEYKVVKNYFAQYIEKFDKDMIIKTSNFRIEN